MKDETDWNWWFDRYDADADADDADFLPAASHNDATEYTDMWKRSKSRIEDKRQGKAPKTDASLPGSDCSAPYRSPWLPRGSSIGFTTYKACTHDPRPVIDLQNTGIKLWAADEAGARAKAPAGILILNCTGTSYGARHKLGRFETALGPHMGAGREEIVLDWADRGAPPVTPTFWSALLKEMKHVGQTDLLIHCVGGHGRTGTALAALVIASAGWPAERTIASVREWHCAKAIESEAQEKYLAELYEALHGTK